jgi:hypothetical protein
MYWSQGALRYFKAEDSGYKLIVEVDPDITRYYRSLMPKWYPKTNPQMYAPHISVVRKEVPGNLEAWGKYEGQLVDFAYSNIVHYGTVYCWLNCFCKRLEEIRLELDLPVDSVYTRPPEGFVKCFHTTLGNRK